MTNTAHLDGLHRIVVLNPKGGSGKTTLATNLAAHYAVRGPAPTLVDCDPEGFCLRWLEKRPPDRPPIHGIKADVLRDSEDGLVLEADTSAVIFDLPAGLTSAETAAYTYFADSILIPIMPSEIDVYSATRFIAELLLDRQLDRRENKLAIVANRARTNTRSYQGLVRFLGSLRIPMIATLRDAQNYVRAASHGIGIVELPPYLTRNDLEPWNGITDWLDRPRAGVFDAEIELEFERLTEEIPAEHYAEELSAEPYEEIG